MPRVRLLVFGLILFGAIGFAFGDGGQRLARILLALAGPPVAASSATLSEHELEEINAMPPNNQVKRLLERTVNHYKGAAEEISKRVEGWTGLIQADKELETMTNTAYFSSDLRVRAAALEIWLAEYGFRKTPETVDALVRDSALADDRRYLRMSNLGILGKRGIEPEKCSTRCRFTYTIPIRAFAVERSTDWLCWARRRLLLRCWIFFTTIHRTICASGRPAIWPIPGCFRASCGRRPYRS